VTADPRPSLANFAVALAAGIALFTYAGSLVDPAAAAETYYLALWSTLLLVALAGLTLPPGLDLACAAGVVTLVVWVVPHGPTRGAAVGLTLTVALAVVALRYLDKTGGRLTWGWAIPTALALQVLCRADRVLGLHLEPSTLVSFVLVPVAVGAVFMTLIPELLNVLTSSLTSVFADAAHFFIPFKEVVFGGLIVLFLIFEPRGLAEIWRRIKAFFLLWPFSY
jgi:hypothetical protein